MPARNAAARAGASVPKRLQQGFRDAPLPGLNSNGIAQSYRATRLTESLSVDRDQEEIVTAALTTLDDPEVPLDEWAATIADCDVPIGVPLAGADPLPGRLDRWLMATGRELIAIRRHIHAHPERSGQEFKTARLVMQRLTEAGLSPRLLPKRNGVICDIRGNGSASTIIALRADLDALPLPDTEGRALPVDRGEHVPRLRSRRPHHRAAGRRPCAGRTGQARRTARHRAPASSNRPRRRRRPVHPR